MLRIPVYIPTKNVIIESFRMVIEYDADEPSFFEKKSEYEILDENGERLTLEQLADRYFANPEACVLIGGLNDANIIHFL